MRHRIALLLIVCTSAWLMTGCNSGSGSRPVSMTIWQDQIESYVTDRGNGDMGVLRDVMIAPGRSGFLASSHDRAEDSTDFCGVLVGVAAHNSRTWVVYLVGEVIKQQVSGIRMAAVTLIDGQARWILGGPDEHAAATYRAFHEQWQQRNRNAETRNVVVGFPNETDRLVMTVTQVSVRVRDEASGTEWSLALPEGADDRSW